LLGLQLEWATASPQRFMVEACSYR
jgi:hypothetical protein